MARARVLRSARDPRKEVVLECGVVFDLPFDGPTGPSRSRSSPTSWEGLPPIVAAGDSPPSVSATVPLMQPGRVPRSRWPSRWQSAIQQRKNFPGWGSPAAIWSLTHD